MFKPTVKTLKILDCKFGYGEFELFIYQFALGISIRYLSCDDMGWMFRLYLGPLKLWFNLRRGIR